jgi:Holliday junction resolvase
MKCYAIFRKELVRGDKNPKWRGGVSMVKGTISGYNKSPIKGRRYEWKTRRILEEQGYYCIRSAGSRGIFDILAFNETEIKLIQVKAGKSPLSPLEREEIEKIVVPSNASKEIWLWRIPRKPPEIIVIKQREENLENY